MRSRVGAWQLRWRMEMLVLMAILALLMFGPRRHGGRPGPIATGVGVVVLVWLAVAFGFGLTVREIVGPVAQP